LRSPSLWPQFLFAAPASAEELANGRYARGEPVDPASQIAFDTAKSSDVNAWRNAERLLAATTDAERAHVADQIHQYAAGCAQMIANPIQVPGYRAQRDAYCKTAAQSQR
jgi:hypothetical protein